MTASQPFLEEFRGQATTSLLSPLFLPSAGKAPRIAFGLISVRAETEECLSDTLLKGRTARERRVCLDGEAGPGPFVTVLMTDFGTVTWFVQPSLWGGLGTSLVLSGLSLEASLLS